MTTGTMLRTGEAARRLGVSRQHIVDMCNEGKLPFVVVGTHRRIPEQAIRAKVASASGLNGDHQSLWLHAALIPRLVNEPNAVMEKARANIARGRASGAIDVHSEPYAREWEEALDDGVGRIITLILDPSDHGSTLRSATPFAGVLPQNEVRALKRVWREQRGRERA